MASNSHALYGDRKRGLCARGRCFVYLALASLALSDAGASALSDAAAHGDSAGVAKLIKSSAGEVNQPGQDGMTPLLWAVQANDVEMTRMLLAAGADANLANRYGIAPLW